MLDFQKNTSLAPCGYGTLVGTNQNTIAKDLSIVYNP